MPSKHGELYKKLDVSLVDHIILERLLGYDKNTEDIQIAYTLETARIIKTPTEPMRYSRKNGASLGGGLITNGNDVIEVSARSK